MNCCCSSISDSQEILAEDYSVNLFLMRVDEALRYREYTDLIMA